MAKYIRQEVKPCQFANGTCMNCAATEQSDCEGWVCSPQRPWVGLTEEEIARTLGIKTHLLAAIRDARAIEAKLKEKNHG